MLQTGNRIHLQPKCIHIILSCNNVINERRKITAKMSDSDISFETDDEGLCDKVHRDIESLLPSRWTDVNADDIEISARNIYSCVSSNGLLTTLEQRPSNTQPSKHSEVCALSILLQITDIHIRNQYHG